MRFTVEEAVLISTFDYSSRTSAMLDIAEGQAKPQTRNCRNCAAP